MQIGEWMILGGIILIIVISFIALGGGMLAIGNAIFYNKQKQRMWKGLEQLLNTYYLLRNYEMFVYEIENLYKYIVAKNQDLSKQYANVSELMEKYLLAIDTGDIEVKVDDINEYKKTLFELKKEYDAKNPLEKIKGTDYLVLKQLLENVEKGALSECKTIVNKIAVEFKGLRDSLVENEKNATKQDFIAKLGIALSIVFGIMTIIQFFV